VLRIVSWHRGYSSYSG